MNYHSKGVDFMEKTKFDELYVGKNKVVWCKTKKLAIELLKRADSLGYSWRGGKSYLDTNWWEEYRESTCYYLSQGLFTNKNSYEEEGYEIIEFKGFDKEV
jgi:hypothetical protein